MSIVQARGERSRTFCWWALLIGSSLSLSCTQPGDKTKWGAATGGALGAGLGAIVGSQTGSAGAGVALGAVAGSLAGGAIGNSLDDVDQAIASRDEAIERHEAEIAANRAEIEELRASGIDQVSELSRGKAPYKSALKGSIVRRDAQGTLIVEKSDGRAEPVLAPYHPNPPRAQPLVEREIIRAPQKGSLREASLQEPSKPVLGDDVPRAKASLPSSIFQGKAQAPSRSVAKNTSKERVEIKNSPAEKVAPIVSKAAKPSAPFNKTEPELVEQGEVVDGEASSESFVENAEPRGEGAPRASLGAMEDSKLIGDLKPPSSNKAVQPAKAKECDSADAEMVRAESLHEDADKLFHYRRALRLCPTNPAYHTTLGELYLSLGRKADAEYEFKEALKLNPNFKKAEQNLSQLKKKNS